MAQVVVKIRTALEPEMFAHYATIAVTRQDVASVSGAPRYMNKGAQEHFMGMAQSKRPCVMRLVQENGEFVEGKYSISEISEDSITISKIWKVG